MRYPTITRQSSKTALAAALLTILAILAPIAAHAEDSATDRNRWFGLSVGAGVGYLPVAKTTLTSLLGYARNSPVVRSTEQAATQLLVAYRF